MSGEVKFERCITLPQVLTWAVNRRQRQQERLAHPWDGDRGFHKADRQLFNDTKLLVKIALALSQKIMAALVIDRL